MPIEFLCPNVDCGKKLSVADEKGGKKVKCPKCKGVLRVPLQSGDTAETLAASGQKREEHTALEELQPILVETGKSAHMAINVEDEIARGGMGKVVQWRHKGLSRQIAAKVMLPNIAKSRQHRLRFLEEAQVTGQLEHPNIVPIHDLGEDPEGNLFFTMKMVQGRSLGQIIKEMVKGSGVMGDGKEADGSSINHLLNIFLKACDGMAFAHSRGVVHRDLKPDNIMVGDYGEVLVMDWGLAKVLSAPGRAGSQPAAEAEEERAGSRRAQEEESARVAETMIDGGKAASARTSFDAPPSRPPTPSSSQTSEDEDIPKSQALTASITTVRSKVEDALTMEGAIQGTPQYMPPEQAEGKIDEIDQRSDIYSLGAILYELLSLKRPVTGKTPHEILLKVIEHRITPPEKAAPKRGIPKELAAIAMKAMSGNKRRRYQTVSELQKDINLYLGGRSVSAKDDSAIEVIAKLVKRNKGLFAAVGVAATIVAVVVSIAFKRVGEKRDEAEAALQKAKTSAQAAANASAKQAQQAMAASRRFSLQAVEAAETGRMVEAERLLADAASVLAASPWLEYAHGKFDEHKTQYKLAAEHYKKSISIDDSIDESRRALKRLKTLESELAAARQVVANIDPQRNPQTLIHTADLFFGVGNWADSAKAYDAAANVLEQTIEAAPADKKPEFKKRVETARYKAGDARASLAVVGFRDEIKNRPVHEQRDIIERKLAQLSSVRPHHNLRFHYTDTSQQFIYAEIHHHDPLKYIHALAGFPIQELKLTYCGKVRSLRPLAGMPIKRLDLWGSGNIDLTTIPKLPLEYLSVRFNKTLNDLSVFKGMKLKYLDVGDTQVSDFSPLREMETLETLEMAHMWHITDISTLRGLKLKRLNFSQTHPKEMSVVKDMPLEELQFYMNGVADLSPIKGKKLRKLVTGHNVQDFSVIKGMPLEHLYVQGAGKFDISVIEGMPLTFLDCSRIKGVETLAPLAGMKLKELYVYETSVSNLKPLAGMPIERLFLESTKVTDLSALKGMPLRYLRLDSTEVTDLSPISGLPIRQLSIPKTKVSDLSPLVECLHLANLHLGGSSVTDLTPLESIRTLHTLTIPDTKVSSLEPLRGLGFSRLDITNAPITDLTPAAGSEHLREFTYAEGQEFNEASKALIEKWKANPRVNVQVVKPQQNQ